MRIVNGNKHLRVILLFMMLMPCQGPSMDTLVHNSTLGNDDLIRFS